MFALQVACKEKLYVERLVSLQQKLSSESCILCVVASNGRGLDAWSLDVQVFESHLQVYTLQQYHATFTECSGVNTGTFTPTGQA